MHTIVTGRWGSASVDTRHERTDDGTTGTARFPPVGKFPSSTVALLSGKGFLIFDEHVNFFALIGEYVSRVQAEYCCGRCLTGIKGTHMLDKTFAKIARGAGEASDLDLLARTAEILDAAAKCSICQSAGELVRDGLERFRDDFVTAVAHGVSETDLEFSAKISAPCMTVCPCHINIPRYVERLQEVRYEEALATIREQMPLPGITGRVCPAPCERACTLANQGTTPVPIKALKRVAADYEMFHNLTPPLEPTVLTEAPAAIVGAGPAGLAAAYYLNRLGHPVTVFDALPLSGGMVGVGIPPYRQPRDVLLRDVEIIAGLGVEIRSGVVFGKDITMDGLFEQGFKTVLLAVGAHKSIPLGLKGEDENVTGAFSGGIDFLRDLNLGKPVQVGERVVIVGGGNTAIDCARTCLRLGAVEVNVVYRRTRDEMPSDPVEIEEALEEGAILKFLTQPIEVLAENGKLVGLRCIRMELGEPDKSGRRRPVPVEGTEFVISADTLIPAIGQQTDLSFLSDDDTVKIGRRGEIKVDRRTMMTTRPGVFAAGDAVSGPLTVVHGVAGGKRAAAMMHQYMTEGSCRPSSEQDLDDILEIIERDVEVPVTPRTETRGGGSAPPKKLDMRHRLTSFDEVDTGFSQYGSYIESSRCLRCYHLVLAASRRS